MNKLDRQNIYKAYAALNIFVKNIDEEDRTSELMEAFSSLHAFIQSDQKQTEKRIQKTMMSIQSKTFQLEPGFNSFMKKLAS